MLLVTLQIVDKIVMMPRVVGIGAFDNLIDEIEYRITIINTIVRHSSN